MLLTENIIQNNLHAWVFPGGGFKGAGQAGFIKRSLELGIQPSATFGTSVGTLHAGFCAMGKYDMIFDLWDKVGKGNGDIITTGYLADIRDGNVVPNIEKIEDILTQHITLGNKIGLITKAGRKKVIKKVSDNFQGIDKVMDNTPLKNLLLEHVRVEDFKMDFWFTIVSLYDGALKVVNQKSFKDDHNLALGMLASTSMPGVWAPVPVIELADGTVLRDCVDGGLRASSPVAVAFSKLQRGIQWKIWVSNPNSVNQRINEAKKNIVVQAAASIDIMLNEGISRDMRQADKWNQVALECPEYALKHDLLHAELFNIEAPLDADGNSLYGRTLDPSPEMIAKRIQLGYESLSLYFPNVA